MQNYQISEFAFIFIKNQQFSTQDMVVDCGSYNKTTYIKQKKEKEKERKEKKNIGNTTLGYVR